MQAHLPTRCAACRYVVCDSFENPCKVYVWDLEANTAFTVGTFGEANWPSPETGRRGLHTHFTPDGELHCLHARCAVQPTAERPHCYSLVQPKAGCYQCDARVLWLTAACGCNVTGYHASVVQTDRTDSTMQLQKQLHHAVAQAWQGHLCLFRGFDTTLILAWYWQITPLWRCKWC